LPVTVSIGVTEPPAQLSTYAIRPPGVIAMARGPAPTVIGSLSPRTTAPDMTVTRSPKVTDPMIVASGAM